MAVRFTAMVHLKSTLAVSAIMMAGLVAASPYPYSRAPDGAQPRLAAAADLVPAAKAAELPATPAVAWQDPPQRISAPAEPVKVAAETSPEPAKPLTERAAPARNAVQPPIGRVAAQAAKEKKVEARRRKIALVAARERRLAARQASSSDAHGQTVAARVEPSHQRIDPIGDILRGLGIGGEG